jgi:hypothetical protein
MLTDDDYFVFMNAFNTQDYGEID